MWKCKVRLLKEDETWASTRRKSINNENIDKNRDVSEFKM